MTVDKMKELKELAEKAAIKIDVNEAADAMIGAMMDNIRAQAKRAGMPSETGIVGVDSRQLVDVATTTFVNVLAHIYASDCGSASLSDVMLIGREAVVQAMVQAMIHNAIDPIKKGHN